MDQTEAAVAAVHPAGPDAIALELETPEGFSAQPGQFIRVGVEVDDDIESRFYTLSSPDTGRTLEVTLTYDPESVVGKRLASLSVEDTVTVAGPFGDAHYDGEPHALVLAGGPGVGAAVGIGERALAEGNDATVVYQDDDPLHEERLSTLADAGATVTIVSTGENLTRALAETTAGDESAFVYGFADFVAAASEALAENGFDTDAAKVESFGPAPE
ncbi:ferredoxin--NADP reductase [Halomarina oriensis]|uniref:Oxidoreductase n=1 Tax=Halomarina oriensis TaxID=671145 RepID=A0A6B0GQK2_9EURY|nr:FAD-binding oxidoreductase [Halomarina oriensis]MWG35647.1 oxidoreductase [Halomarina oriensis]